MLLHEALALPFSVAKARVLSDWNNRPIKALAVRNGRCKHANTRWQYEDGDKEIVTYCFLMHFNTPESLFYFEQPLDWETVNPNAKALP